MHEVYQLSLSKLGCLYRRLKFHFISSLRFPIHECYNIHKVIAYTKKVQRPTTQLYTLWRRGFFCIFLFVLSRFVRGHYKHAPNIITIALYLVWIAIHTLWSLVEQRGQKERARVYSALSDNINGESVELLFFCCICVYMSQCSSQWIEQQQQRVKPSMSLQTSKTEQKNPQTSRREGEGEREVHWFKLKVIRALLI